MVVLGLAPKNSKKFNGPILSEYREFSYTRPGLIMGFSPYISPGLKSGAGNFPPGLKFGFYHNEQSQLQLWLGKGQSPILVHKSVQR